MRLNVLYFKNASALVGYTGFFTSEISQDTRTGGKRKRRREICIFGSWLLQLKL